MDVRHKFFQNDKQREDHPPFYMTFVDDLRMKQPTDLWTASCPQVAIKISTRWLGCLPDFAHSSRVSGASCFSLVYRPYTDPELPLQYLP